MTAAHFPLDRLAEALRRDGFTVNIRAGAQGKSARMFADRGYYMGCQAICNHHTGSSGDNPAADINHIDGKGGTDPGFAISNSYTARNGDITLIASGPTYTEGAGGPYGIIPAGRANDVCFSNEIGGGGRPFPQAQQDAVVALTWHAGKIAAEVWGWTDDPFSPWRSFGHMEWTTRKWDPGGISKWGTSNNTSWDMDAFRADVARYQSGDSDMKLLPAARLLDSRGGEYGNPNFDTYKPKAQSTHTIKVTGAAGLAAAQVTVTSQYTDTPGFLTAWPAGARPNTSFSNPQPARPDNIHEARPHTLFVPLDANGAFKLYTHSRTHLFVDFTGICLV